MLHLNVYGNVSLNIIAGIPSPQCCTCPSNWAAPAGWSGGTGPVAVIDFEDTSCISYEGGTEEQMKIPAHVRIYGVP